MSRSHTQEHGLAAYARVRRLLDEQRCVVLDGATGTELIEVTGTRPELDEQLWGVEEIITSPAAVRDVHRAYAEVGCDVLTTDTWGLASAIRRGVVSPRVHWMDVARRGIALAREAAVEAGRGDDVAVAFSVNGDVDTEDGETLGLLARVLEDERPDMVLLETLSLVRPSTYETVETLVATGIPVWLSFRRCRHGVCGVYGEHWGGPEGDAFGRAAHRFEQLGVEALLVNCIPPDHVAGMVSWLRDFTDVPLGVYPNLGYMSAAGWRDEHAVDPAGYAELAVGWRAEGAQIIGGCCGVGPDHIDAVARALAGTPVGHARVAPVADDEALTAAPPLTDVRDRPVFPLAMPSLRVEEGVDPPGPDSLLLWKHIELERIGAHQRCLDVGSGAGLLAVQLARNGAHHVHALDADSLAAANTLTNAFRNGVADRVTSEAVDLYPWVPGERYDVVVASLDQDPADPFATPVSHRPLDYWGRNLVDHLLDLLPVALAEDGVAYVVQRSVIGQEATVGRLRERGLHARVLDYAFAPVTVAPAQLERVETLSDAYHLEFGGAAYVVDYLLEIRPATA